MGPFDVPIDGLSLDGVMYVVVSTGVTFTQAGAPDFSRERTLLTRFDELTRMFAVMRVISHRPTGHFINLTMRLVANGLPGLPATGPYVLMFGSGDYRKSDAYLAAVPAKDFVSGANTRYFAGMKGVEPTWVDTDDAAAPIVIQPTVGEMSVLFVQQLGLWLMTYGDTQGQELRYAEQPWGPWSDAVPIFNAVRDHAYGAFIHDPRLQPDDGLDGPVTTGDPTKVFGGDYGPYMLERFTTVDADTLNLQFLMSTRNPYTVVRMRTALRIHR